MSQKRAAEERAVVGAVGIKRAACTMVKQHFQPLCAPTAFQSHICVGCGSSGGCAHYQPGRAPPTPCCRRGRPGGWSEALCVLRGAPGQASMM
jgi:hypothetical protein